MDDLSHELTTPAFLVDRNIVEQNCDRMRRKALDSGVAFRPHVKTHKTIEIARMQAGMAGGPITVSTLAEADFFADAGFRDITYAVPIAPDKLPRAAALAKRIERLNILIDSERVLRAVESFGGVWDVFLKVDCGYHRAGVDPADPDSGRLAVAIARSSAVHFQGLLTHAGHSYDAASVDEIRRIAAEESACLTRFRALLADEGLGEVTRSVGSTPTLSVIESFSESDEVRPGNYVFYDAFQASIGSCAPNDIAVSVLTTVIGSYPERHHAIVDAGALALSRDLGAGHEFGVVCDLDLRPINARLVSISQEHGKLETTTHLPAGTQLRIIPNHSCLTAAMYDRYVVLDGGKPVAEWSPVRGW